MTTVRVTRVARLAVVGVTVDFTVVFIGRGFCVLMTVDAAELQEVGGQVTFRALDSRMRSGIDWKGMFEDRLVPGDVLGEVAGVTRGRESGCGMIGILS